MFALTWRTSASLPLFVVLITVPSLLLALWLLCNHTAGWLSVVEVAWTWNVCAGIIPIPALPLFLRVITVLSATVALPLSVAESRTKNISPIPLSPTSLYMIPPFFLWSMVSVEILNINADSVSVAVAEVLMTNSAFVLSWTTNFPSLGEAVPIPTRELVVSTTKTSVPSFFSTKNAEVELPLSDFTWRSPLTISS